MVRPPYAVTTLQGMRNRLGDSVELAHVRGGDIAEAREAAREADAVVIVTGLAARDEGESIPLLKGGGDRESLALPLEQVKLIEALCAESTRCIVVLEGGSAITLEQWRDKPQAILMAWYPGMEGGNAIADILLGRSNPRGKLPLTFPKSAEQLPHFDSRQRSIQYGYFHGYRLLDKKGQEPAFPFGFGLSYTRYIYSNLRLDLETITRDETLRATVDIRNKGQMEGWEVAQLYVAYPESRVERPVKELKGFAAVSLSPGETKTVSIPLSAQDLAYYDTETRSWQVEETEYIVYVGPSSRRDDLLEAHFHISA
jgi:beta-glucosidase